METITIHKQAGKNTWYAKFNTDNMIISTPFFLTMDKQTVIDKIQALNPNSKVK